MGDVGDAFKAYRASQKALKAQFGIDCPGCKEKLPRAQPSRLLPGQRCRSCGYVAPNSAGRQAVRE